MYVAPENLRLYVYDMMISYSDCFRLNVYLTLALVHFLGSISSVRNGKKVHGQTLESQDRKILPHFDYCARYI